MSLRGGRQQRRDILIARVVHPAILASFRRSGVLDQQGIGDVGDAPVRGLQQRRDLVTVHIIQIDVVLHQEQGEVGVLNNDAIH